MTVTYSIRVYHFLAEIFHVMITIYGADVNYLDIISLFIVTHISQQLMRSCYMYLYNISII